MNFASLMSKEISKAKSSAQAQAQGQASGPADSTAEKTSDKQYVKRSELEAERLAAYNAEQEKLQQEREDRQDRKRKLDDEEAEQRRQREEKKRRLAEESKRRREEEAETKERERRRRLGLGPGLSEQLPSGEADSKEGTPADLEEEDIETDELVSQFRERGEPVRLFGESDKGRQKRYRRLVQVQRESTPQQQQQKQKQRTDGPISTSLELLPESEMKVPPKLPADDEGRKYLFRQLASYFTMVLKEWQIALSRREDGVKQSLQGKQAYNAMVQSRENMKPLFRQLENGNVEEEVLEPVREIVWNAQERRYVDANDGYLRLSIGKA